MPFWISSTRQHEADESGSSPEAATPPWRAMTVMTKEELRKAIYAEIVAGMMLLRTPPESIALAESMSDPHDICAALERCGAPIAYIAAVGSYKNECPDEESLHQLMDINRMVAETVEPATTPQLDAALATFSFTAAPAATAACV